MEDYTPTTEAVRSGFVLLAAGDNLGAQQEAANGFDRWLDDHDVEVAAAALKNYAHLRLHGESDRLTDAELDAIEQRSREWASPLAIKCPACGSNPGDKCYGNGPMNRAHEERREAVRQRVITDAPALLAEVRRLREAEVRRLQAAVERVREMHAGEPYAQGPDYCDECEHKWPCPTIAALDGER